MGTSGSYGGSGRKDWQKAKQLLLDFPQVSPSQPGSADRDSIDDALFGPLWTTIGDALVGQDPSLKQPLPDEQMISIAHLMGGIRSGGGGGSGSAAGRGTTGQTGASGRRQRGSARQVVANAARGGMVLGAGYAIRQNDGAALADYGLSIENLRGLSPVRQCAAILDALLGQGAHPDEHALRKASMESLKEILQSEIPPPEADAVGGFVVNYVYELVLVELQAQLDAGAVNAAESARRERGIRHYLERRIAQAKATITGRVKASDLRSLAARLTSEAIRIIRARPETS